MTPALIPATQSPRSMAPCFVQSLSYASGFQAAHSGSQRGKPPQGYPSPTPDAKAAHRAKNPRKGGGFGTLILEGGGRDIYIVMPV